MQGSLLNRASATTDLMTLFGALELNWWSLNPFDFFLWPEPLLALKSTGLVKGKALIRMKEFSKSSPFPKNRIVSIVARLPASLRRGLEKASGHNVVFVKYYGHSQWKGVGPLKPRFFVQGVSSKREIEILQECGVPKGQWP